MLDYYQIKKGSWLSEIAFALMHLHTKTNNNKYGFNDTTVLP